MSSAKKSTQQALTDDNSHERLKPILCENKISFFKMLSADFFTQHALTVLIHSELNYYKV